MNDDARWSDLVGSMLVALGWGLLLFEGFIFMRAS